MGFVGKVMDNVNGTEWFYIVGIMIFIALFIAIVYRTVRIPKSTLEDYKSAILDSDDTSNEKKVYQSE